MAALAIFSAGYGLGGIPSRTYITSIPITANDNVLFASIGNLIIAGGEFIRSYGHQNFLSMVLGGSHRADSLRCGFGGDDGMLGCLDTRGRLYVVSSGFDASDPVNEGVSNTIADRGGVSRDALVNELTRLLSRPGTCCLICRSKGSSPIISNIAMASNNRVAITYKEAPNRQDDQLCYLAEFENMQAFKEWFAKPEDERNEPLKRNTVRGKPKQLLGGTATFLLSMESGEVYTWGDPRFQSLGRPIIGGNATPADQPGIVGGLAGLKVTKVAIGGWISAALSEDRALYLWGLQTQPNIFDLRQYGNINCLNPQASEQLSLVEIPSLDGEPADILDVAIGMEHIAVITEHRKMFVVGDNIEGKLGINGDQDFYEDWQEVTSVARPRAVFASFFNTFAIVEHENATGSQGSNPTATENEVSKRVGTSLNS